MKNRKKSHSAHYYSLLSVAISLILSSEAQTQEADSLPVITVTGKKISDPSFSLNKEQLKKRRFASNDTVALLDGVSGISLYSGGGVSSLPVINGLGDDRLKITVDGMTITSACPNHMNPALSYMDPAALNQINVYAGIVPVSQGGDSIGGAIAVKSAPPVFAKQGEAWKTSGSATAFHRSNGKVNSLSAQLNTASEQWSLAYIGNTVNADNYKDGEGKEIPASRYKVQNHAIKLATLLGSDILTFDTSWQNIPLQGYPNQSMDMTYNKSLAFNAAYLGNFAWGALEARIFRQHVRHKMDVLQDKAAAAGFSPSSSYMPMETDAIDLGYAIVNTSQLKDNQILRLGHEFHRYRLDDWWPPLAGSIGMGPQTFWNINGGHRERLAVFGEWDTTISDQLSTQIGARVEQVKMNTGKVQGYYDANAPYGDAYQTDATMFNSKNHQRKDHNIDLTATARYVNNTNEIYDIGFSRKTRSPNLHERYTWSNEAMMAGLMNNWFGDLNSYVGRLDLKPEIAYSIKANADWHDKENQTWQVKISPFYTYVKDYINATPNMSSNPYGMSGLVGRQSLVFTNQNAYLYGVDFSGKTLLGKAYGEWAIRSNVSYTRGKTHAGDNLYNIMPLNARLAIEHTLGAWSSTLEGVFVKAKNNLNVVRAEQATSGYAIANYRTTYAIHPSVTLEAGIDNIFNRQYYLPLGGLEYVSGGMTIPLKPLRAKGRSINVGMSVNF